MNPLERLTAIEDIRQLKARYFRYVDTRDWAGLATVFTDDILFDRTYGRAVQDPVTGIWSPPLPAGPQLVHGRDAVLAMVRQAVGHLTTVHHGHMPEIAILDAANATGLWAMSDELRDSNGRLILAGRGHYHEVYRKTGDGWQIARCKLTRLSLVRGGNDGN